MHSTTRGSCWEAIPTCGAGELQTEKGLLIAKSEVCLQKKESPDSQTGSARAIPSPKGRLTKTCPRHATPSLKPVEKGKLEEKEAAL